MDSAPQRIAILGTCLLAGFSATLWRAESRAAKPRDASVATSWNQKTAAAYLDRRAAWWMAWPRAARDHDTFCVSCHTAVPYVLSRSVLRKGLAESGPSTNEQRILDNVAKRVRLWKEVAPFYTDADRGMYKSVESRGTESVLNALILASRDASSGAASPLLSDDARMALGNMWAEQQTTGKDKGAWLWLRFANEPWEADDSDFYGATLAAIAVGSAPNNYRAKSEIQDNLKMLSEYLNRESAAQTPINRAVLLWASVKLPGLLEPQRQKAIVEELLSKQRPDGGWSLTSLSGDWKRHDGTPQERKSDGYATGLVTFALQQAGVPRDDPQEKRGFAWLTANQEKSEGFWLSYSLNKNMENHISPETALFMNDAATAYAVLALSEADRH
jgi:squalene-hopene/tetraprenyl-beta-curcumene cyclase